MKSNSRVFSLAAFVTTLALVPCAMGQSSQADQTVLIQQLLKRIDQLEATQKQMQEQLNKGAAPAQTATVERAQLVPAAEEAPAEQSTDASGAHVLGPVQFRGFSDFNYGQAWFEKLPPGGLKGSPRSFTSGDFDLFTNTKLSEHWSMLGEMLVTSDASNEFGIEMDRLLLSYRKSDRFKISFGKFNTALGYFTNEFHRAQYFQTAIGRPIMYSDEDNGGLMPVHSIGVTATGTALSPALGLHWVAEVANGRSSVFPEIPIQNFQDDNNGKAVNLAVYTRPEGLNGFQAGFSAYMNNLHPAGLPEVGQNIFTFHAVYVGDRLEWLNEAAILRHNVHNGGRTYHAITSYSLLSVKLGKYRPYFRYDYQNVAEEDPIFADRARSNGPTVGISRRLSNYIVFKVQYGRLALRDATSTNALQSQIAFAF
jgi:hypothetical protein